jgi:hypothetical protein
MADVSGEPPQPRPRRRWVLPALLAALVTAAVAISGVLVTRPDKPAALAAAPKRDVPMADLVVRDGDLVRGFGMVVAEPGKPVRFCAPDADASIGGPELPDADAAPVAPACPGVTLTGADLGRLTDREEHDGTVSGAAWVEGRYHAGTVAVTRQTPVSPAAPAPDPLGGPLPPPPCAAPDAGWQPGQLDDGAVGTLDSYLEAHPDQYGGDEISYPDGEPSPSDDPEPPPGPGPTQVLVVGSVLDQARAQRELAAIFPGNLCVTRAAHTRRQVDAVAARFDPLLGKTPQAYQSGPDYFAGRYTVNLFLLDEPTYATLTGADRNSGVLAADPWLRPLGR